MKVYRDINNLPAFKNAIVTIGTFDGVHFGHQEIISRLKKLSELHNGENIILTFHPHPRFVLNPDDHTLKLINTLEEKIHLLEKYGVDNLVVAEFSVDFSQMPALDYIEKFLVEKFHPKTIVIGYNHQFGKNRTGDIKLLKKHAHDFNYEVEEISKQMLEDISISSTKIRNALNEGNVKLAGELMGHFFSMNGFVIKGNGRGRKIGFPTANIEITLPYKLIPKIGVYAVYVKYQEGKYEGMLNIGYRPTFEGTNKTIEVNIFDFDKSIYGENIEIVFVDFIREEYKFNSKDELSKQLVKDKIEALKLL